MAKDEQMLAAAEQESCQQEEPGSDVSPHMVH